MAKPEKEIHSSHIEHEERDDFWDHDYLSLLTQKWHLSNRKDILDVGVGLGHWSRALLKYANPDFKFTGVDFEKYWIEKAPEYYHSQYPNIAKNQFNFIQANAEKLPFKDETFDFVTCHTLLMHMSKPFKAITEIKRVLKRDGLFVCVEPINILNRLEFNNYNITNKLTPEEQSTLYHFWACYHKGLITENRGDNDIARSIPCLLSKANFSDIQCVQNSKALLTLPDDKTYNPEPLLIDDKSVSLAKIGGASQALIIKAKETNKKLDNLMKDHFEKNEFSSLGSLNMFFFSAIKN